MEIKQYPLSFFENKFKAEKNSKIKTRIQMLMHLREGYTQREVSKMLRVSTGIVPYWKARFEKEEIDGLKDKKGRGVKPQMTKEQLNMFRSALDEPITMENGYSRGWKSKDARIFLIEEFGLNYTRQHICRLLNDVGCSLQVPRPRNKRRNQKEVDKFKRGFKKKKNFG